MSSNVDLQGTNSEQRIRELSSALQREERVSRALREVGIALGSTLDLDALLELILEKLTVLLEADRSALYLLDEEKQELVSRLVVGEKVRSIRMKVGHGLAGEVALTGRTIRVRDAYKDRRFERDWDLLGGYRTTSMLAAPLKNHLGRTIGVIQVLNKRSAEEFTDEDEAILSALSRQAAVAIDNSRLFLSLIQKNKQLSETTDQLERRVRDLSLLFELERATARARTPEELVRAAVDNVAPACDARAGAVVIAEEESGDLIAYLQDRESPSEFLRARLKSGEGLLGHVIATARTLAISDATADPRFEPRIEGQLPFPIQSVVAVPLDGDTAPIGALALFNPKEGRPFGPEDLSILRLVAANVATAVRLFHASAAREREERLTAIGRLLSHVIHDFKSPMTVISGSVQLMAETDDRAKRQEYTEEILRQFDTLSEMQREVLEFARGESGIFARRVYLRKFLEELARQVRLEIGQQPIELVLQVDSKLVGRFDEGRMARAIHNLARNAIEAMGSGGGKLTIGAQVQEKNLVIFVEDTGPGIPSELEGRLFQSFVTANKQGGTGLGLAIVKKIADEHGGTVDVQSSARGARFEIRLPIRSGPGSSPAERPGRRSPRAPAAAKSQ